MEDLGEIANKLHKASTTLYVAREALGFLALANKKYSLSERGVEDGMELGRAVNKYFSDMRELGMLK